MGPRLFTSENVSLCPDGLHRVYAAVDAASGLHGLDAEVRAQLIRKLCDIAEIAFLSIGADHWDESKLLRLHAADTVVLYSVDANGVLVHDVVESQVA
ncbi:MAG: hypothetical protein ABR567_20565 [Myxococcales bacterium]